MAQSRWPGDRQCHSGLSIVLRQGEWGVQTPATGESRIRNHWQRGLQADLPLAREAPSLSTSSQLAGFSEAPGSLARGVLNQPGVAARLGLLGLLAQLADTGMTMARRIRMTATIAINSTSRFNGPAVISVSRDSLASSNPLFVPADIRLRIVP